MVHRICLIFLLFSLMLATINIDRSASVAGHHHRSDSGYNGIMFAFKTRRKNNESLDDSSS
jgi:hypothetical protein